MTVARCSIIAVSILRRCCPRRVCGLQVWLKQPLVVLEDIVERHDAVEAFATDPELRERLRDQSFRGVVLQPSTRPDPLVWPQRMSADRHHGMADRPDHTRLTHEKAIPPIMCRLDSNLIMVQACPTWSG